MCCRSALNVMAKPMGLLDVSTPLQVYGNGRVYTHTHRRRGVREQGSLIRVERYPEELDSGNSGRSSV